VVLENFSFITEEASAQEDFEWRSGPSRRQIKEIAAAFCRFSRATEYMPLRSAVDGFILAIPPPLGLQAPTSTDGTRDPGTERMLLRLIRAELNLALRRRAPRAAPGSGGVLAVLARCRSLAGGAIAGEGASSLFVNGVSFREVLTALALWRNASMMPSDVRRAHQERMADVVRTACALVIADFLRGAAARRRRGQRAAAPAQQRAAGAPAMDVPHRAASATAAAAAAAGDTAEVAASAWASTQAEGVTRRLAALPQQASSPGRVLSYRVAAAPQTRLRDAACVPASAAGQPRRLATLRPLAGLTGTSGRSPLEEEERVAQAAVTWKSATPAAAVAAAVAADALAAAERRVRLARLRPLPGSGPGGAGVSGPRAGV
jgi:hypothetical protein